MQNEQNNIMTEINWKSDSFEVIRAKNLLYAFLQEQQELKGKYPKVDEYHNRRILELQNIINTGA
jgi:hypothetical protein